MTPEASLALFVRYSPGNALRPHYYKRTSPPIEEEEDEKKIYDCNCPSCWKREIDIDVVFFFSTMTPKKVRHPTPSGEAEAGHPSQPQREERSSPHNVVVARPLHTADAPPPEDRA
ncbi:hypothetical protein ACLOJK_041481 [Asimina triloba]